MDSKTVQRSTLCRSRRELSNEYLLAKIGVDTAENEPLEVWGKIFNIIHWCPWLHLHAVDVQDLAVAPRGGESHGVEAEAPAYDRSRLGRVSSSLLAFGEF